MHKEIWAGDDMTDIFDVARKADVSVKTVSRVLNGHSSVRPRTRRLVLQAMEELGYRPNSFARGFRKARSGTIGLVVRDLVNAVSLDLISAVEMVVRRHHYSLLLYDSAGEKETEAANLEDLFERRVEGLILSALGEPPPELELFTRAQTPVVGISIERWPASIPHLAETDPRPTAEAMVEHLRNLGHERIGIVVARMLPYSSRTSMYGKLLRELGIGNDRSLVAASTTEEECVEAVATLVSRPDRPTALVCIRHAFAPFALGGIRDAGLRVPDDVSFLVFGDSAWARFYDPPITVVTYDYSDLGRAAANYIFARLEGQTGDELLGGTQSKLIIRESCGPVPTGLDVKGMNR